MPSETLRGLISDYLLMVILAVILIYLWMSAPDARGQLLLQDSQAVGRTQQFDREPMPEPVIHTKSAGTYGTLTITNDVTPHRRAKLLSKISKETETCQCFSAMAERSGDDGREAQGFAFKFDVEEGNRDMMCNNMSMLFVRAP